jgi:predicted transcriptional regulator
MLASTIISYAVPPLTLKDSGDKALNWMSDFHIRHLPVLNKGKFLGILSEEEVLNFENSELAIDRNNPDLIHKSVYANQHLYDVMKLIVDTGLTIVPVIDNDNNFLGLITLESLIKFFSETVALTQPGGIIILEVLPRDYSLAEIARIVESENTKILSAFVTSPYGKENLELTLKLSRQDLKHVIATLLRFGYEIKNSFYESDYNDSLKDRYDALMKYLNP